MWSLNVSVPGHCLCFYLMIEPHHDKTNKMACSLSKDSDQPGHAQADLSFRWAHMPFCWFCHDAAHILILM